MHIFREQPAIPWRDRGPDFFSFSAKTKAPVLPNFEPTPLLVHGLEMLPGLPICTSSQPEPRTLAAFKPVNTSSCLTALLMLCLVSFSFVAVAGKTTPTGAVSSTTWESYIAEASQRFGVPAHWIRAVMQLESNGDKTAASPKGAIGLMQVMPETYAELRLRYDLGDDPYAPRDNILAGAAYLREMHERYGPTGFLAAYNAGPGRYEDYLMRARPLPEETQDYVAALAPILGVPMLARGPESASMASQSPTLAATYDDGAHSRASNENRFSPKTSPFQIRPSTQARILFANIRVANEATPAGRRTVDMTALEPSENRALRAISAAEEHLLGRTSKVAQPSLESSGNELFAVRLAHAGK